MSIPEALLSFAAVALVLTLIPGLDTTLVLRSALTQGRGRAVMTALGIACGALCWGAAAAVGAAALLAASEVAYRVVTLAGAAYMAYLGVTMIVRSFRADPAHAADAPAASLSSPWRAFAVGTGTNVLNPKIGVFYIATIPQFIPQGTQPLAMGLLLAAVHAVLSLAWFAVIITAASMARRRLADPRAVRVIDRVAGVVLVGFAAKLALSPKAV